MLFKKPVLDRIARGEIVVAFRRWRRPTVRAGGRLRTPVGELAIEAVAPTTPEAITDVEARAAGFASRAEALEQLQTGDGQLYRIEFRLKHEDVRTALAATAEIDLETVAEIRGTLRALDGRSRGSAWTDTWLRLVHANPAAAAADLACMARVETAVFKRRMRQLKDLGLTHSLAVGYRLSPRGESFLEAIASGGRPGPAQRSRTSVLVRAAAATDVDALARIWLDGWTDAHGDLLPPDLVRSRTLGDFRLRLQEGLASTDVAVAEERQVGFAMVRNDEIDEFHIDRPARGTGAAAALMSHALDRIRRAGHQRAWLACAIGNHRAARFYEGTGWSLTGIMTIRLVSAQGPMPVDVWRYEIALGDETGAFDGGACRPTTG